MGGGGDCQLSQPIGLFVPWRLGVYGLILAGFYVVFFLSLYRSGIWLIDSSGAPIYTDFTGLWTLGAQALHGKAALVYDQVERVRAVRELVGPGFTLFFSCPHPPTYFLIFAPLALLPYFRAFATWDFVTLLGTIAVVCLIARRRWAIPLLLASPFIAWNLSGGQTGLMMTSLFGASLLLLERRPMLAGCFIGLLSFKPQFGLLLPVALLASSQWRAFMSAAGTVALLVALSLALFGAELAIDFPKGLADYNQLFLVANPDQARVPSLGLQTIYGVVRALHGGPWLAWFVQGAAAITVAVVIWLVWRSSTRFTLKAAALPAAAFIVTPYAYAYDMAAITISLAFVVRDQIDFGSSYGEHAVMTALLAIGLVILITFGVVPLGPIVAIALLGVILRRDLSWWVASPLRLLRVFRKVEGLRFL